MTEAIGWLGGSFDPPHVGHRQLALDALAALPLTQLRFLPAAQPWQKSPSAPARDRAAMVQLVIAAEPPSVRKRLALDDRELRRTGATYTIDTLRELRHELPDTPLVLVMGGDQFERFDTWRDWQEIGDLAHLAIARRADRIPALNPVLQPFVDERLRRDPRDLLERNGGMLIELPMTPVDISSTELRQLLADPATRADGERLAAMVAPAVLDYIRTHHLYLGPDGH